MAKQKRPIEIKMGLAEWMGTYGDMMTLLLCFFVLMFAMSTVDAEKMKAVAASFSNSPQYSLFEAKTAGMLETLGNGIVQQPEAKGESDMDYERITEGQNELHDMAEDFKTYFAQNKLQDQIIVEQNDRYITLNFKDGILFDSGKADLKESSLPALSMVAEELMKYPENDIKIEGHTDNVPIHTDKFPNNWYLSAARAISVAMYFTDEKQFNPERISTEGYGEFRPVTDNSTPQNRSENRRVEIKILSKYYSGGGNDIG